MTSTNQSTFGIYRRLLRYCFHYRIRVIVLVFLSILVASAFTSIIFGVGTFIRVLYDAEKDVLPLVNSMAGDVQGFADSIRPYAAILPEDIGERFRNRVMGMRDDRDYALKVLSGMLLFLSALGGGARFLQEYYAGGVGARVATRLNREMYENLLSLSHRYYEGRISGEIIARFTNDSQAVNNGLVAVFVKLLREPVKIILCLSLAFSIDAFLTGIVLLAVSPLYFVVIVVGKNVRVNVKRSLQKMATVTSLVTETVAGINVIKAFQMEAFQNSRMRNELNRLQKHRVRLVRADAVITPATEFMMVLGIVAFMMFSEQRIQNSSLSGGQLILLFASLAALLDPLRKLSKVHVLIQTSVASAERVFAVLDARSEIVEKEDARALRPLAKSLRFEDVHFSYDPAVEILKGINIEISSGEMVALVGLSGGGKSTVAKLIPRFYDVTKGRITIDGTDIRDATLTSLRDQIAIVTQDTILFNDTIRHNIAFGSEGFSDDDIRRAAKAAHIAEFIERLADNYDHILDEFGANLSGGQRQRIAIARAVLKNPTILILDEATSNLDSESEQAIQEAIAEFIVGRAALVIAHRLSTIKQADRIVVVEDGRIVEEGTHDALLAKGGAYKRLYALQFAGEEVAVEDSDRRAL